MVLKKILKKSSKSTQVLHSGNYKQIVPTAIAVFQEFAWEALTSYIPKKKNEA